MDNYETEGSKKRLRKVLNADSHLAKNTTTYFTQRGVSESSKQSILQSAQSANRFYLKNMTAAVDMYKDQLRHTTRLQEIKYKQVNTSRQFGQT